MTDKDFPSEVDLIRAAAAGDHVAYKVIMERYAPLVNAQLYGSVKSTDVEDLLQEVLLSAFRSLKQLNKAQAIGPWLLRITRNRIADHYRRESRQVAVDPVRSSGSDAGRMADFPEPSPGPAQRVQTSQIYEQLELAMGQLSDTYRIVLYLRLREEYTSPEIAKLLGLKESAVRARIKRGLEKLRKELVKRGMRPNQG